VVKKYSDHSFLPIELPSSQGENDKTQHAELEWKPSNRASAPLTPRPYTK